jgi:hypothetical protein
MRRRTVLAGGLAAVGAAAVGGYWWWQRGGDAEQAPVLTSYADLMGCRFTPDAVAPLENATARLIPVPEVPAGTAIWGATGRDHRGHIWFGVSTRDEPAASAHLFEYDPDHDVVHGRGDVLSELRRLGTLRRGEQQMKIHSRIVEADDGCLYFASMDEHGEDTAGGTLPTWGSHLWRLRPANHRWEHLSAVPEGLIAVAGSGRRVVALGYFGHTLYQLDCRTGAITSAHVGSVGGHISRNCFCDIRGHSYAPRMQEGPGPGRLRTSLVELDPELGEVADTPIAYYTRTRDEDSHGIVAFQPLADRSIVFATDQGYLYHVVPQEVGPAEVRMLGWFHPGGRAYTPALFTSDGAHHLMGLARTAGRGNDGNGAWAWVVYDLAGRRSVAVPLRLPSVNGQPLREVLLYGSITRDNAGCCYVGGSFERNGEWRPLLVQTRPLAL